MCDILLFDGVWSEILRVEQLEDFYSVTLFSLKINKLTRINYTTVTR